jgi:hypothetical protein
MVSGKTPPEIGKLYIKSVDRILPCTGALRLRLFSWHSGSNGLSTMEARALVFLL